MVSTLPPRLRSVVAVSTPCRPSPPRNAFAELHVFAHHRIEFWGSGRRLGPGGGVKGEEIFHRLAFSMRSRAELRAILRQGRAGLENFDMGLSEAATFFGEIF
jgi:hypothetical protein